MRICKILLIFHKKSSMLSLDVLLSCIPNLVTFEVATTRVLLALLQEGTRHVVFVKLLDLTL